MHATLPLPDLQQHCTQKVKETGHTASCMQVHLAAAPCSTPTSKPLLAMQQPSDNPVNGHQPLQGDSEGFRYLFCSTQQPPSHTEIMKRIMAADYKLPPSRPVTAECADLLSRILTQVRGGICWS